MLGKKETYKYMGILEAEMKEKNLKYGTEKTTRRQIILEKSYLRDKHLGSSAK